MNTIVQISLDLISIPEALDTRRPSLDEGMLLGQLAIHKDHQGLGHARSLLLFALRTALRASREIGSFGVITHPIDEQAREFYRRWGFQDLPFDPRRAMIVRMVDLERNGIDGIDGIER